MLTIKEKQYKMIKALGLDVGYLIEMEYGPHHHMFSICESATKERYFLKSVCGDTYNFGISHLLSNEWVVIRPEWISMQFKNNPFIEQKYQDVANMHPEFMIYTGGRMQGKEQMRREFFRYSPKIDNVYYNTDKKTTVVIWSNGETTKVKCAPEDKFDLENGIMAAIAKYHCDNKSKTLRSTIARAVKKAKDTTKKEQ